jgi:predicted outer membrane repeat protein
MKSSPSLHPRRLLVVLGVLLRCAPFAPLAHAAAATWYVPGDFPTIQAALDAAATSDEIIVGPGRYFENIHFVGRDVQLRALTPSTSLADPLDPNFASIIDGSQPADPNVASVVRMTGTETPACVLDGFTLAGGTGVLLADGYTVGGGIYGMQSLATISRCTIRDNTARFGGGLCICNGAISGCHIVENWTSYPGSNHSGAGLQGCNGTISDCLIAQNQGYEGAGLHTCNYALIVNCDIRDNAATYIGGGAMWCDYSTFVNCNFSGNTASTSGYGAGGAVFSQIATYINCTFANNSSLMGGAIYAWQSFAPTIHNCVLWGNQAPTGAQIALNAGDTPCTLVIDYSDLQGGQEDIWLANENCHVQWGAGMLTQDPLFAVPDAGDFRLAAGSPAIDAANNDVLPPSVTTDLDGQPRFVDDPDTPDTGHGTPPLVDMGAYEFQGVPHLPGDLNCDAAVNFGDINPFVQILVDFAGWQAAHPGCPWQNGDTNTDGSVDFADINPFIALLTGL